MKNTHGLVILLAIAAAAVAAQTISTENWTTADDHRNMMEQLGIKALRPGPSGQPTAPNQANYDEALANPFPKLPALLTLKNGKTVTKADQWWKQRRPEIVEEFEREIYGRIPKHVPKVTWSVAENLTGTIGGRAVNGRQLGDQSGRGDAGRG
jgi:hypothetical protein